jgi:hypothetical protein
MEFRGGNMTNISRAIFWVTVLLMSVTVYSGYAATPDKQSSLLVVFRDGHQKSFYISEITRIEFRNAAMVLVKGGQQENIPVSEIAHIDFSSAGNALAFGRNHFLGKWEVGTGNGSNFVITLDRDGSARKSMGASHGTWVVVGGEARISWDDGWHDAIRKVGTKHEKFAYAPGKSFDDEPSNVTDARSLNAQPI